MTHAHRDLATVEPWIRSLERSRKRRALLPKARREHNRRKHLSAALATAAVAGPAAPVAAAQVSSNVSAAIAAESPANRAIEVREGGLPLQLGSQGALVAEVQRELHISADGVFGVQTDSAVREYQRVAGLEVDGIVGLATWGALFESHTASGAAIGGSNVAPQVTQQVERTLEQAGQELAPQAQVESGADLGAQAAPETTTSAPEGTTSTPVPVSTGSACGSSTISSPVHGTVTSEFGQRWGRNHDGIDIGAPTGTPVHAAACGTVSLAGQQSGYGNIVCITHTSRFTTCYAHLSRFGVSSGARVQQGQVIGYVGCTGSCTGPHLHFETRVGGQAQNPRGYLSGAAIPGASASSAKASVAGASSAGTMTSTTATTAGTDVGAPAAISTGADTTAVTEAVAPAEASTGADTTAVTEAVAPAQASTGADTAAVTEAVAEAAVPEEAAVPAQAETPVAAEPVAAETTVAAEQVAVTPAAEPAAAVSTAAPAPAPVEASVAVNSAE
jgi:murein DD-endopeptidase MepM/ murein hydrolase activator NlpD